MQTSTSNPLPTSCEKLPVLRRDDRQATANESVKYLQRRLTDYGYPLTVDGFFGPKTEAVVRKFQTTAALLVDGIVGPQTWQALGACVIYSEGC